MNSYIGCRVRKEAIKQIDEYVRYSNLESNRLTIYTRSDFLREAVEDKLGRIKKK